MFFRSFLALPWSRYLRWYGSLKFHACCRDIRLTSSPFLSFPQLTQHRNQVPVHLASLVLNQVNSLLHGRVSSQLDSPHLNPVASQQVLLVNRVRIQLDDPHRNPVASRQLPLDNRPPTPQISLLARLQSMRVQPTATG